MTIVYRLEEHTHPVFRIVRQTGEDTSEVMQEFESEHEARKFMYEQAGVKNSPEGKDTNWRPFFWGADMIVVDGSVALVSRGEDAVAYDRGPA